MPERTRRQIEIEDPEGERAALELRLKKKGELVERLRAGLARAQERRIAEAKARVVRRVELIASRERAAKALLERWEKKLAYAQRKVKKLKVKVRYYARKNRS